MNDEVMKYDDPMMNVAVEPPGLEDDTDFLDWIAAQPAQRLFMKATRQRVFTMVGVAKVKLAEDPRPIGNPKMFVNLVRRKMLDQVIAMLS